MADELDTKSPQQRLAQSRRAIARHLRKHDADDENFEGNGPHAEAMDSARNARNGASPTGAWWPILKHASLSWWRHHPAHLAGELAVPVIQSYAREKPLQLLGVAAGVGAAAVLIRPWRLVSANRLVTSVLGSNELSGVVLSVLSSNLKKEKR